MVAMMMQRMRPHMHMHTISFSFLFCQNQSAHPMQNVAHPHASTAASAPAPFQAPFKLHPHRRHLSASFT